MKDGKYPYSEPFATWFRVMLEEREAINSRMAAGTSEPGPVAESNGNADPITPNQIGFLKRLGSTERPATKKEASALIDQILERKKQEAIEKGKR